MQINATKILQLDFITPIMRSILLQRLPSFILVILIVLLSVQLATTGWTIIKVFYQPSVTIEASQFDSQQQFSRQALLLDYQALSDMHLFGANNASVVIERGPVSAPETRLKLILYGVFAGNSLNQGAAIIGSQSGKQKHYTVGDKVTTGVWLSEVRKDHVLLRSGSGFELLKFPKQSSAGIMIKQNIIKQAPRLPTVINKQSFLDNVRIVPVFTGRGKGLKGYRILPKKNREVYDRLGIKPSDIVVSINGISVSDERKAMKLINELVSSDQVEVQIERRGKIETIVLKLK